MIELKPGVRIFGMRPEMLVPIHIAEGLWAAHGIETLVITAVIDGKHKRQSFHYSGVAVDLRINTMAVELRPAAVQKLKEALGPDFVVLHELIGQKEEHVHVHFLPAEAY